MSALYVFDAYGTLLNLQGPLIQLRGEIGPQTDRLGEIWRVKQLEYGWVRALAGRYTDFWSLTEAALDHAAARTGGLDPEVRARLLAAYRRLDPYPDAGPTLARLKRAGHRTAVLSNADPAMLDEAVKAARLDGLLDAWLSVDPLRTYKTDPRAYALACERFGVSPGDVSFVSSNRWDIAGATAYGFATIWLNRTGQPDEYADLPPGQVIASLDELAA